ncbi:MAG: hypothetical protein EXR08_09355 [Alphaproteobacteria bacterium]|nr:hypothetical protein [Alphaproteobacteria bacterium]
MARARSKLASGRAVNPDQQIVLRRWGVQTEGHHHAGVRCGGGGHTRHPYRGLKVWRSRAATFKRQMELAALGKNPGRGWWVHE